MKDRDTHAIYPPNEDDDDTGRATIFVLALAMAAFAAVVLCVLGSWP